MYRIHKYRINTKIWLKESSSRRLYQKSREKYNFKKMSKKIQNYQRNTKMSRQTIHTSNFVAGISKRVLNSAYPSVRHSSYPFLGWDIIKVISPLFSVALFSIFPGSTQQRRPCRYIWQDFGIHYAIRVQILATCVILHVKRVGLLIYDLLGS